jgi:hypothetical protein
MVEAQDIKSATQAQLLRSVLVTGLQVQHKAAFATELIRVLEEGQNDNVQLFGNSSRLSLLVYDPWQLCLFQMELPVGQ